MKKTMSLTIELSDEQAAVPAAKARALGVSKEQYVRQVLEQDLVPDWLRKSWEAARQTGLSAISMEEIDAEIAAARKARHEGFS